MKITLPIHMRDHYENVSAELLFDLAPHLADVATFAIHRPARSEYGIYRRHWFIANVETGALVSHDRNKSKAIKGAQNRLAGEDAQSFAERIDRAPHPTVDVARTKTPRIRP